MGVSTECVMSHTCQPVLNYSIYMSVCMAVSIYVSICVCMHKHALVKNAVVTPYEKLGVFTIVIARTYPQVLDYISRICVRVTLMYVFVCMCKHV